MSVYVSFIFCTSFLSSEHFSKYPYGGLGQVLCGNLITVQAVPDFAVFHYVGNSYFVAVYYPYRSDHLPYRLCVMGCTVCIGYYLDFVSYSSYTLLTGFNPTIKKEMFQLTKEQMTFLTAIYKRDLTLFEIFDKTGLCYENYLSLLESKDFMNTYVIIYERNRFEDDLYGLTEAGIEAVEKNLDSKSDKLFGRRTTIIAIVISVLSLAVSIYSLNSQRYLESKLSEIENFVLSGYQSETPNPQ